MKTKAIVYDGVDQVRLGEVTLPECGPKQIVGKTLFTFVSPGTELRVLGGHYGAEGNYPLVPGYAAISKVVEVGAEVKGFRVGDMVSCRNSVRFADMNVMWGGEAGMHVYDTESEDSPVLLPQGLAEDAYLPYSAAEVAAISLRGVEAADPKEGETALVIGQGMIGQFSAMFLKLRGAKVVVADIDQNRLDESLKTGVSAAVNLSEKGAEERVARLGNGGFDIVVEASGSIPGVELAYKMIRRKPQNYSKEYKVEPIRFYGHDWPRLVMQANYIKEVSNNPFSFFSGEGVTILTPADRGVEERQRVVEYVRAGKVDMTPFLGNIVKCDDMPEQYRKLQKREIVSLVGDWR